MPECACGCGEIVSPGGRMAVSERRPLRRWPKTDEGLSRYRHPGGYVIHRCKRSWSERVGAMRGQAGDIPMYWWEVARLGERPKRWRQFDTLRDARAWCDEQTDARNA